MALAGLLLPGVSAAKETDLGATGHVVFARGGQLLEVDVTAPKPTVRATLADKAQVEDMEATHDGKLLVVTTAAQSIWFKEGRLIEQECAGKARPSPRGECLACLEAAGVRLIQTGGKLIRRLPEDLRDVNFYGSGTAELVALAPDAVVAFPPMKPEARRVVAKSAARSHLLVAPDGGRGVAVFGPKEASRIFSFALDGKGVPRQLGGPGVPLRWSWDSKWVLLTEGLPPEDEGGGEGASLDAPDRFLVSAPKGKKKKRKEADPLTRACAVRAVGGEAKCWNYYDGLGFSPDSQFVLLRRDGNLYLGKIAGVKADKPKLLVEAAEPGAVWLP